MPIHYYMNCFLKIYLRPIIPLLRGMAKENLPSIQQIGLHAD